MGLCLVNRHSWPILYIIFLKKLGTPFAQTNGGTNIYKRGTMKTCEKCQGSMVMERAVDLEVGLSILYFACLNCGKRLQAEKEPRPLVH